MLLLLDNPLVNSEITPISPGSLANEGTPEKTATFGLRADYSLPSAVSDFASVSSLPFPFYLRLLMQFVHTILLSDLKQDWRVHLLAS